MKARLCEQIIQTSEKMYKAHAPECLYCNYNLKYY